MTDDAMRRREFLRWLSALFSFILLGCVDKDRIPEQKKEGADFKRNSTVYVLKTEDREQGIRDLLKQFDLESLSGKRIALKANYNSADPFPASTHIDTLSTIVEALNEINADVVLAERSGMGNTRAVLEETGVIELAGKLGFEVVVLDDLISGEWIREKGTHWKKGFLFPRIFKDVDAVIQTCCLKTHRYGGHFTLSLKNSVGMIAKYDPADDYNYMSELHTSRHQRQMISEINAAYMPELVVMDGILGFSKGGPDTGSLIEPGILAASNDRVALDAVGVGLLRIYGTTNEVSRGNIFQQDQIARAVELGLGAAGPEKIEVVPLNDGALDICARIETELGSG